MKYVSSKDLSYSDMAFRSWNIWYMACAVITFELMALQCTPQVNIFSLLLEK